MEVTDKILVCIEGEDRVFDYSQFDLSFDSTNEEILTALSEPIKEETGYDIKRDGDWLYKTRKATNTRNVYVIPNSTAGDETAISYLENEERYKAYTQIVQGCSHLWSKGKLQEDRLRPVLDNFAMLSERDPLFLAHLTSYIFKKLDSKDLKVVATLASHLSDADGTPFSLGSKYKKPNWRIIGQAAFQKLDPKLALRVLELANTKRAFGSKPAATHFPRSMRRSAKKYLAYRENNPKALKGLRSAGLSKTVQKMYRLSHQAPSKEASQLLGWSQKPGFPGAGATKTKMFDFDGMTDKQIAEKIRADKLSPMAVLGALPDKVTPVIAAAILEQANGNQTVILTELFESQGLMQHKQVKELYEQKIKTAKTVLDRVDQIQKGISEESMKALKSAKSEKRKEMTGDIGKVFVHIDISSSMNAALVLAKDCGSTIAECVKEPSKNFAWGTFAGSGRLVPNPDSWEKDAFHARLYGIRSGGMTDCLALFEESRKRKTDVDIFITDQGHNGANMDSVIDRCVSKYGSPRCVVIVNVGSACNALEMAFKRSSIPVTVVSPDSLKESALISQVLRTAVEGPMSVLDSIMETPLLRLPKWWTSVCGDKK